MHPEPLQTGQDRRQLVPAPQGQANLFDGRDLETGLGLEMVAHDGGRWRMLQGQTPESPRTFNHSSNIRTLPFASNLMRARSVAALAAHYLPARSLHRRSPEPQPRCPPVLSSAQKSIIAPTESRGIFLPVWYNGSHVKIRTNVRLHVILDEQPFWLRPPMASTSRGVVTFGCHVFNMPTV